MYAIALALLLSQPLPMPKEYADPYATAYAEASKTGRPLVVFVNTSSRKIQGCVTVRVDALNGDPTPRVFATNIDAKTGHSGPVDSSDESILATVQRTVSRQAIPFRLPSAERDADDLGRRAWPKSVPFPEGAIRYRPSRFTQEIAVTNDRDRITPVPRSRLLAKWHQSGGMEGISGYRSDLYKLLADEPRTGIVNIPVWNGSNYQNNRGWRRDYADGTKFFDVLSNTETGKVFELRMAEKKSGEWTRKVIFSDHAERPMGYTGLSQSCASCHDEAGSGNYGVGLVPGSDTIISDPFPALES